MALGNLLGLFGTGIAKAVTNYATEKKNTPTSTPSYNKSSGTSQNKNTSYNEHADYINKNYSGGLDAYSKVQNDRYNTALQNNDVDMLNKLQADSQRVGYNLGSTQPQFDNTAYQNQMNDLLSAIQTYQSQPVNMPYPDMSDFNFGGIQNQLEDLTSNLQNYKGADYMNMDEAVARANSQLGGMYNQTLNQALESYNKNAIQRGMFGQMPVEALKQQAIAENELNKANAVNSMGANLYSQDFNMAQQKDNNYYNQMKRLADLLGQQYNNELGQYQNSVNNYTNNYNMARQKDNDFYDNIYRQLDILGTQYGLQKDQYNNDLSYFNTQTNQKQNAQDTAYNRAWDKFKTLGYVTSDIAEILRIPVGTPTSSYSSKTSGTKGGTTQPTEPTLTSLTPAQMENYIQLATDILTNEKGKYVYNENTEKNEFIPYKPTTQEIFQQTASMLQALGYDNTTINEYLKGIAKNTPKSIPSRSPDSNAPSVLDNLYNMGLLGGNENYSTQFDLDMINWLNNQN